MRATTSLIAALSAALLLAPPAAHAQFSQSYNFLKAVRDRDGAKVTEIIDKPGALIINTKDQATGDTALHIVTRRRDSTWMNFLLAKNAQVDARNGEGLTALMIAAQLGFVDGARTLLSERANVNATNSRGESALILAVQNRDVAMVRTLLAAGADVARPDRVAGMSARDYAARDTRAGAILKLIDEAKPAKPAAKAAGPVL